MRRALRSALYRNGPVPVRAELLLQAARQEVAPAALQVVLAEVGAWKARAFPLNGSDVLALGLTAGPEVGALLRQVEDWWFAGDMAADRAACLAELRRLHHESQGTGKT